MKILRRLPPSILVTLGLAPGCVVVNDFGATDAAADGTGTSSAAGGAAESDDGLDGSSGVPPGATSGEPSEPPAFWEVLWEGGPQSNSRYTRVNIGPSGDIVAAGYLEVPSQELRGVVHRYSVAGDRLAAAVGLGPADLTYLGGCEGEDGVMRIVPRLHTEGANVVGSLMVVDYAADATLQGLHLYEGAAESEEFHGNAFQVACGENGDVWLAVSTVWPQQTLLMRFDAAGFAGEWWHEGYAEEVTASAGTVHVVLSHDDAEENIWRRLGADGAVLQEQALPGNVDRLEVRGDRVVMVEYVGEDGAAHVVMTDLLGVELWRHEELGGHEFFVQALALGPEGQLAVNARASDYSFDDLFVLRPDGTVEWSIPVEVEQVPSAGDIIVDMAFGDDGSLVFVGGASWSTPEDPNINQAWIVRYTDPG